MNMHKRTNALILLLALFIVAAGCATEKEKYPDLIEMDLLSKGVPIVIRAPEGAIVQVKDQVVQRDITVRKGTDFSLQIFESDAMQRDISKIKARMLSEVQGNPYFQKVVSEDENGFIYETAIDSSYINYGFRHVRLQGDKEYVFQTSLRGKFSVEDVEKMHAAVQ